MVLRRQAVTKAVVLAGVLVGGREAHSQLVELATAGVARGTFLGRVLDGNTVDLFTGTSPSPSFTIRLARIDAPEPDQPYGHEARQHLGDLLREEYVVSCSAREADAHGRWLANCGVVNHAMVLDGAAWADDPLPCHRLVNSACSSVVMPLQEDERQARAARRGLWARPPAIPPWLWRATRNSDRHLPSEALGVEDRAATENQQTN